MINGKRIAVVMPAYNAEKTLEMTVRELSDVVDIKILVDDSSKDQTARSLPQARRADLCARRQLRLWPQPADLLSRSPRRRRGHRGHGPSRLPVHALPGSGHGRHDRQRRLRHGARLAHSRSGALKGGMPLYKYVANRFLTAFQNLFSASSSPSTTPASAPSRANCSRPFRCSKTPTTSSSTTR
jgi:hypothetical protein